MMNAAKSSQNDPEKRDELSLAAAVAQVVELQEVALKRLHGELHMSAEEALSNECLLSISPDHHPKYKFFAEKGTLTIDLELSLHLKTTSNQELDEASQPVLSALVAYKLTYVLRAPPPPAELMDSLFLAFAKVNGLYNAWPYFRAAIQDLTARMSIPPITLPVYRILRRPERVLEGRDRI